MENNLINCLFCASICGGGVDDVGVVVKREIIETEHDDEFIIATDETEREHLKPSFLLQNILKIPEQQARQLLNTENTHYPDEGQAQLCSSCEPLALKFFKTFQEMSELERILDEIGTEVKDKILESQDVKGPSTWNKIRRQAVNLGN